MAKKMVDEIDCNLLFSFFHCLKMCSDVPLDQCSYQDLEVNKLIVHLRMCMYAVIIVLEKSKEFETKHDLDTDFQALQSILDLGVDCVQNKDISSSQPVIIQNPFHKNSSQEVSVFPFHDFRINESKLVNCLTIIRFKF